ncbi:Late embryogenesis abundant protein [Parasponia andersonii]|uniref:Late embryogenesis abundant protein n=1 Tax=Parasponia andersonii TaxID=3476 RepID=A0A2P5E040_PARAD|nr:Late embryogenesis abundant protein [Parasponia andersonii]
MAEEHAQQEPPQCQVHAHKMTNEKYCARESNGRRVLCTCVSIFLILAGVTILTLWLVYRPHKPRFTVVGAAIYQLNTTSTLATASSSLPPQPPLVSTTMQFTVVTRNPNRRVSIYYDRLTAFVSYRNQAITPQVTLPPLFHERRSTVAVSPMLGGGGPVPVSAEVMNGLTVDEAYGVVGLRLVLLGRLRWKTGAIKTAHYGVYVKCDVLLGLKKGVVGQVPLLGTPGCKVDI